MLIIPIERSLPIADAQKKIESTLIEYGINWKIEIVGRSVFTTKCGLYDRHGKLLDSGYGKGEKEASIAGALFEAAEHWFCQFQNSSKENIQYLESSQMVERKRFVEYLPAALLLDTPSAIMAFRLYGRVGRMEKRIYPVAFSNPKYVDELYTNKSLYLPDSFDYSNIGSYCSNSGVAIGSNETEATIHGILEAIERDTLSKFLVSAFLTRKKSALRVVDRNSLSDELRILMESVESEVDHSILLLELENEHGIPVFCSALSKSSFEIEITGYGCSLSNEHAVRRSLYELVQCYHVTAQFHPKEFKKKMQSTLSNLKHQNFHIRCAKLKFSEWCEEIGYEKINFSDTAFIHAPKDIFEYLSVLTQLVEKSGRRVYSTIVNRLIGGQVVTHSFIEGQDHFYCVTNGALVLPNIRVL